MAIICLLVFVATVPVSIILPMLPYIGGAYGGTPFEVSLLFALMPAITIFVAPIWGRWSDRIGRKPIFLTTLGSSSIAFLMFALADSLPAMFLARAIQGVTNGSVAVAFAMVADSTDHASRARSIGYMSGAMASGFFIGPVLGGVFMTGDAGFDHTLPCLFAAGLCAIGALAGVFILQETRRPRAAVQAASRGAAAVTRAAVSRATLALIIVQFLIGGFTSATNQFAFTYWAQGAHGWGPSSVSFGLAAIGAAYLVSTLGVVGPLTKRFGDEGTLLIGALIEVLGTAVFLLGGSSIAVGIGGIALAILGSGTWTTVLSSVLSKVSPPDRTGYMLGVANGANMIGRVLGPIISGLLLPVALTAPFGANFGLTLAVAIGAARVVWVAHRQKG